MTAELPSLKLFNAEEGSFSKRKESRLNARSAIESHRSKYGSDDLPGNTSNYRKVKRNSEGQVLQVKFVDDVAAPDVGMKAAAPGINNTVHVDHGHYERWARVPAAGKRITKSSLLRGIQQLKARMKREDINMEIVGLGKRCNDTENEQRMLGSEDKTYHIRELKRNMLLTADKLPENKYSQVRREKSSANIEQFLPKTIVPLRNQLKPNSKLIDSGVFKQENENHSVIAEQEVRLSRNAERDSAKLRHGVSRIRDRSAFPISVYQPISIGDHVFLINEPVKENESVNFKKTEYKRKTNAKTSNMLFMTDRSKQNEVLNRTPELHVHLDALLGGKSASLTNSFQRSRTAVGALLPPRIQKRTQFVVSNAELYDFSQLSEIRHSMADKFLERSQTELLFPNKSLRNGFRVMNE